MSRDKILAALQQNQPELVPLPPDLSFEREGLDLTAKFRSMAEGIGSTVYEVSSVEEIQSLVAANFPEAKRVLRTT